MTKRICVYCGSGFGNRPSYLEAAKELGSILVERGYGLVYGGAHVGLMGVIADAVLEAGGEVDGVIPTHLTDRELAHPGLTRLHVVPSMHERKMKMAELATAFIALPGGLGTLEEVAESATWNQLGLQAKPLGLLDIEGYWQPLLGLLDHMVGEGFLRAESRALWITASDPRVLLDALSVWTPPAHGKWDRVADSSAESAAELRVKG